MTLLRNISGITLLLSSMIANAAEDRLYPPPPPPGAASVRVIDVRTKPNGDPISVGEQELKLSSQPSAFKYVNQGAVSLKSPGFSGTKNVEAGNFYSVLVGNKVSVLYKEENPPLTQALVVLYNFTLIDALNLKTDDGNTDVVSVKGPFQVKSQPVNPLKVGFSVYAGDRKIGSIPAAQLQRGTSFGIMVVGPRSDPRVIVSPGPSLAN